MVIYYFCRTGAHNQATLQAAFFLGVENALWWRLITCSSCSYSLISACTWWITRGGGGGGGGRGGTQRNTKEKSKQTQIYWSLRGCLG